MGLERDHSLYKRGNRMKLWIAQHMPDWLIYWCAIVLGAYATSGKYGSTIVSELKFMEALKRWERKDTRLGSDGPNV